MDEQPRTAAGPARGSRTGVLRVRLNRLIMLQASLWLVFMINPAVYAFQLAQSHPHPGLVLFWSWGGLLLFAVIYALGFGILGAAPQGTVRGVTGLLLLLLIPTLLLVPVIGAWTLSLTAYFMAVPAFLIPRGRGLAPAWALALAGASWLALTRPEGWLLMLVSQVFAGIFITVGVLTDLREQRHALLQKRLTQAAEREHIARDVHDLLGHSLTVISLKAEVASAHLEEEASPAARAAREELRQISEITRSALAEVRATVIRLREPELAGELNAATRALQTAGIDADLPSPRQLEGLTPAAQALFSWGLREGITNVIRHSGATRCTVRITPTELIIDDDGRGTSPSSGGSDSAHRATSAAPGHRPGPGGSGLLGLRQRAREAGGGVVLSASPAWSEEGAGACGTRLRVSLDEPSEEVRT